ncbi:hypothetical protein KIL84_014888 [Mauremys mutica]|uniref:Uncharacterized protein n=1 Tax=Mauremys mutica TaxID=74926 RepID=A0A9D4B161_9SAUR|nr:hypothetical protein KIL84_014888 [Mauremys mutica]
MMYRHILLSSKVLSLPVISIPPNYVLSIDDALLSMFQTILTGICQVFNFKTKNFPLIRNEAGRSFAAFKAGCPCVKVFCSPSHQWLKSTLKALRQGTDRGTATQ